MSPSLVRLCDPLASDLAMCACVWAPTATSKCRKWWFITWLTQIDDRLLHRIDRSTYFFFFAHSPVLCAPEVAQQTDIQLCERGNYRTFLILLILSIEESFFFLFRPVLAAFDTWNIKAIRIWSGSDRIPRLSAPKGCPLHSTKYCFCPTRN